MLTAEQKLFTFLLLISYEKYDAQFVCLFLAGCLELNT